MKRRSRFLLILAVLPTIVLGWLALGLCQARVMDDWPTYEAFRCRECGGPASVNPDCIEEWGCRQCGYSTYRPKRTFRLGTFADFGSVPAYLDSMRSADAIGTYEGSIYQVWCESAH